MSNTNQPLCCPPLQTSPLDQVDAKRLADVFKALADPARLTLLSHIASQGEACACDLPQIINKSQPTTSHHLSQLVACGLLHREQRGKWAWFSPNRGRLAELRDALGD